MKIKTLHSLRYLALVCLLSLVVLGNVYGFLENFVSLTKFADFQSNRANHSTQPVWNVPVDAIITFVNGSDPIFQNDLRKHRSENQVRHASNAARFRDHEELRFLLRSIEKYAGFFRHIHLVVAYESQVPSWLNRSHPSLKVWYHRHLFANASHLPSFSSLAIEANCHRIPGLAELAVYFNDDFMLVNHISPGTFYDLKPESGHMAGSQSEFSLSTRLANFHLRNDLAYRFPDKPVTSAAEHAFWVNSGMYASLAVESVCNDTSRIRGFRRWHLHTPYVFMKSVITTAQKYVNISAALRKSSASRFRCVDCISTVLMHHWFAQCAMGLPAVQVPSRRGRLNVKIDAAGPGHIVEIQKSIKVIQAAIDENALDFLIINDEAQNEPTSFGREVDKVVIQWRTRLLGTASAFENETMIQS